MAKMIDIAEFPMTEEQSNYLAKLQYDVDGLRVLMTQIADTDGIDDAKYDKVLKKYQDAYAMMRIGLDEVYHEVAPEYAGSSNDYNIYASFTAHKLFIQAPEDKVEK